MEFPLRYYAALLGRRLTLPDIRLEDPRLHQSYTQTLEMDVHPIEGTEWTPEERKEYVSDQMDPFEANPLIRARLELMRETFYATVGDIDSVISPTDLRTVLIGSPNIDIQALRAHATNDLDPRAIGDKHRVDWLWEILEEFDAQQRTMFMEFVTGSSRVPIEGIKDFKVHVIMTATYETARFPSAHTCFNTLDIYLYESKQIFKEKLEHAILTKTMATS